MRPVRFRVPCGMASREERLVGELRRVGERITPVRRAVLRELIATRGHLTAEDLADRIQRTLPSAHLATIYRTLEVLERHGLIDHAHLGHGRAVYHLADDPHHHLVCEVCGAVIEVPDALFRDLSGTLRAEYGFRIRPHHFAVLGRCRACAAAGPADG